MEEKTDKYYCQCCFEEWVFCPEDFEEGYKPKYCPLCIMPFWEMVIESYRIEGVKFVVYMLYQRIKRRFWQYRMFFEELF